MMSVYKGNDPAEKARYDRRRQVVSRAMRIKWIRNQRIEERLFSGLGLSCGVLAPSELDKSNMSHRYPKGKDDLFFTCSECGTHLGVIDTVNRLIEARTPPERD